MGDRKEMMSSTGFDLAPGAGIAYVKLVVEASKLAPRYAGKETLYPCLVGQQRLSLI